MQYYNFKEKFIEINKKGWIKGVNNTTNSVGLTFESILGKPADSMYFPDYYGLEIKTTTRFSCYPLSLFSLSFDGPFLFETNRILQHYGKIDYTYKDKKTLIGELNTSYPVKLSKYYFKLNVDRNENKLFLCVFNNDVLIEKKSYILFDTISNRVKLKLSNLVIVTASKKKINNDLYFRYYKYKIYKLKNNIDLFNLIEDGIIKIQIICRISRSGNMVGKQRNKSLLFQINKSDLDVLFDFVEEYDADIVSKNQYNC